MADYDVGVTGLSSPPASAVRTSYRPAVSVRNNGLHNAQASGYLRIYAAGLLIFETEVYSGTLAPGATGTADAVDYWTPPAEGTYIVQGYLSTPLDQVEPNNNLNPTTIIVAGGPVPPPPTVPLHASQHEEGGDDPVNVDGLPGVLTDRQPAQPHAAQHQAGGDDRINIAGLAGVAGDPQTPIQHGNAHHTPDMATSAELTAHSGASSAHTAATNLANRETTGDLTGLVPNAQVSAGTIAAEADEDLNAHGLRFDRLMGPTNPVHHANRHLNNGLDPIGLPLSFYTIASAKTIHPGDGYITLLETSFAADEIHSDSLAQFDSAGSISIDTGPGQGLTLRLTLHTNAGDTHLWATLIALPPSGVHDFHFIAKAGIDSPGLWRAFGHLLIVSTGVPATNEHVIPLAIAAGIALPEGAILRLQAQPEDWNEHTLLSQAFGSARFNSPFVAPV